MIHLSADRTDNTVQNCFDDRFQVKDSHHIVFDSFKQLFGGTIQFVGTHVSFFYSFIIGESNFLPGLSNRLRFRPAGMRGFWTIDKSTLPIIIIIIRIARGYEFEDAI